MTVTDTHHRQVGEVLLEVYFRKKCVCMFFMMCIFCTCCPRSVMNNNNSGKIVDFQRGI